MTGAYLGHAACQCRGRADCDTCSAFTVIFDNVADRRAEAVEQEVEDRRIALALARQRAATHRRPVRDMPHRTRIDVDALADAVVLRLGKVL